MRRLWQRRRVLSQRYAELSEDEKYGQLDVIAEKADETPILMILEPDESARYRMDKIYYGALVVQTNKVRENQHSAQLTLTEWT